MSAVPPLLKHKRTRRCIVALCNWCRRDGIVWLAPLSFSSKLRRDQFATPRRFAGSTSDPFPARLAICSTSGSIAPQCGARLSRLQHGSRFGSYRTDMPPIVSVEALANSGDGRERRADFKGDAREDQFLAPGRSDGLGHLRIVERVHRRAIDDWNARQRLDEFWKGRAPHAVPRGRCRFCRLSSTVGKQVRAMCSSACNFDLLTPGPLRGV